MKKIRKGSGLIGVALLLAILLAVYFGMDLIGGEEEEEVLFFSRMNPEEIQSVAVNGETNNYVLEREGDQWICPELPDDEISESQVEYKLDIVAEIEAVRKLEVSEDSMASYGLENPAFTMTFTMADGSTRIIRIGNLAPDGNDYAMIEGDPCVYTISTTVQLALDVSPDTLIQVEEESEGEAAEETVEESSEVVE